MFWNPSNPSNVRGMRQVEVAARTLRLSVRDYAVRDLRQLDSALAKILQEPADALFVMNDGFFWSHVRRITNFASKHRIPASCALKDYVHGGGLMSYGPDITHGFRRAAAYVDKILRGAKPGDLPIEQPTKFELVINLKRARALGIAIPRSVLARADLVIP